MSEHATTTDIYGLDLGDKKSEICVLSAGGEVVEETRIPTTQEGFMRYFEEREPTVVVFEVGVHSPWVSHLLEDLGYHVIVANPRRVKLISANHRKDDRVDAELLARLGRADAKLLSPIKHRSKETQSDMAMVRSRMALVRARSKLVVSVRNLAKSQGLRIPGCSTDSFYSKAVVALPNELRKSLTPILESIKKLTLEIRACDKMMATLCETKYPETLRLMQVQGVGVVTALTFVLLLEDPKRFPNGRVVGAYLGLVPRRRQSGDKDPKLGISKVGDGPMRALLVQCAHYILGSHGQDSELKRKGMRIVEAGGAGAKKRAVVAVARKLACVLYSLWVSGERYQVFPGGKPAILQEAA